MTQENKQLLLKDLCARLPYNVIISKSVYGHDPGLYYLDLYNLAELRDGDPVIIKPYLRPLSSITEEEQRYIWDKYGPSFFVADFEDAGDVSELFNYCKMNISRAPSFVDWLNEHHFDYRGLIEKCLALEAPEGMY